MYMIFLDRISYGSLPYRLYHDSSVAVDRYVWFGMGGEGSDWFADYFALSYRRFYDWHHYWT